MSHRPFMPAPYAMAAGATPNEMTSASESSSRPIAECTRRERATRPSSTSSARSEEHTSELQSPYDLVCRLLLEKKKHNRPACRHVPVTLPQPPRPTAGRRTWLLRV